MTYLRDELRFPMLGEKEELAFGQLQTLSGDGLELRLKQRFLYSAEKLRACEYDIMVDGQKAGNFAALFEDDPAVLGGQGNVGVRLDPRYRGQGLPAKTVTAALPLYKQHGLSILITCDPDSEAIAKACETLQARYLDTVQEQGKPKKRFTLAV